VDTPVEPPQGATVDDPGSTASALSVGKLAATRSTTWRPAGPWTTIRCIRNSNFSWRAGPLAPSAIV